MYHSGFDQRKRTTVNHTDDEIYYKNVTSCRLEGLDILGMLISSIFGAGADPSVGEHEGEESMRVGRLLDLAAAPEVVPVGQKFTEPEGGDLEGPGKALGSAVTSGAAHCDSGLEKVVRSDPTGVKLREQQLPHANKVSLQVNSSVCSLRQWPVSPPCRTAICLQIDLLPFQISCNLSLQANTNLNYGRTRILENAVPI